MIVFLALAFLGFGVEVIEETDNDDVPDESEDLIGESVDTVDNDNNDDVSDVLLEYLDKTLFNIESSCWLNFMITT
jgi:hypothetical protein